MDEKLLRDAGVRGAGPDKSLPEKEDLRNVTLADGRPIIAAFVPDVLPLVMTDEAREQRHAASDALQDAILAEPDLVKSCGDQTVEKAREILAKYIKLVQV